MGPESLVLTCRRVAEHLAECPACNPAGGEQADPEDLCDTGQRLLRSREDIEKSRIFEGVDAYTLQAVSCLQSAVSSSQAISRQRSAMENSFHDSFC